MYVTYRTLRLVALFAGAPASGRAHPLHTAMAELSAAPGGALTLRVRAFSDDFSAAVARAAATTVLANYEVPDSAAARYVAARVRLERDGVPVVWRLVSQRRDGDATWLELRSERTMPLKGARILNTLLMELHADQINLVRAQYDGRSFTTLFSRGDGAKPLP